MDKIIIGYDSNTRLYILPKSHKKVRVNGESIDSQNVNRSLRVTSIKPEKYEELHVNNNVVGMVLDDGTEVSIEEFNNVCNKYKNEQTYDYEEDEWLDVENEIRLAKYVKNCRRVHETVETVIERSIEIVNIPVSEYNDITPYDTLDDIVSTGNCLCKYTPTPVAYLKEYCEKLGLRYVNDSKKTDNGTWSNSNHSGIDFAVINGEYLQLGRKISFREINSSYQECVERREKDIKDVRELVDRKLKEQDSTLMTNEEKSTYYRTLRYVRDQIYKLDVKKSSYDNKRYLLNNIEKKMNSIIIDE